FHELGTVQAYRGDGCSTRRRPADDNVALLTPTEVIRPHLSTWVEEPHHLSGEGIEGCDPVALVIVAHRAQKPQVLPHGGTAEGLGNDVVDLHRRAGDPRGGQAVTTAAPRFSRNLLAQRLLDVATAHLPRAVPRRHGLAA